MLIITLLYMAAPAAAPSITGGQEPRFDKHPIGPSAGVATSTNPKPAASLAPSSYPATVNAVVLKVDFPPDSDSSTTGTGEWIDPAYDDTGNGADYWLLKNQTLLQDYYAQASYNNLTLNITINPTVYRMPHNMGSYGAETAASLENLIHDAVTAADADVNFSTYQAIFIVHAGPGQETDINGDSPADIWSLYYHDTRISLGDSDSTPALVADGVSIQEALIMPQTGSQDLLTVDPLGVFAHEFGHWLGLPDLYATGVFGPNWDGIGSWGLMGYGIYRGTPLGSSPAYPGAWSKTYLGWVTPTLMNPDTDPGSLFLPAVESSPSIVKIPNDSTGRSYFLLENRQQMGFDTGLAGRGLLVWQVDEDAIANGMDGNTVNTSKGTPGVRVIEADGDDALLTYGGDQGSAGDPFPGTSGNSHFTPWTLPNSASKNPGGWLYLTNVTQQGDGSVNFSVAFSPQMPTNISEDLSLTNGFELQWQASSASDFSHYNIYIGEQLFTTVNRNEFVTIPALKDEDFRVSAVDTSGHESAVSSQTGVPEDLRCFIATAAYGSPIQPYVTLLRHFRDHYLLSSGLGKAFVDTYYSLSPPLAMFISRHTILRALVRVLLLPIIGFAWIAMYMGLIDALLLTLMTLLMLRQGIKQGRRLIPYVEVRR